MKTGIKSSEGKHKENRLHIAGGFFWIQLFFSLWRSIYSFKATIAKLLKVRVSFSAILSASSFSCFVTLRDEYVRQMYIFNKVKHSHFESQKKESFESAKKSWNEFQESIKTVQQADKLLKVKDNFISQKNSMQVQNAPAYSK